LIASVFSSGEFFISGVLVDELGPLTVELDVASDFSDVETVDSGDELVVFFGFLLFLFGVVSVSSSSSCFE